MKVIRMLEFRLIVTAGLTLALVLLEATRTFAQPADHVVLISIDGFRPDFYRETGWGAVNLRLNALAGASADAVTPIFPSLTFPNHTSAITGVRSATHGIVHNSPPSLDGQPVEWYWYEKDIRVKTLWDAVREKGGVTASVNWPVSAGTAIDYNIPIIKRTGFTQLEITADYTVPAGLMDEVQERATGKLDSISFNTNEDLLIMDQNVARIAGYLIREYKPMLTTVRLSCVDHFEHLEGRHGDMVKRAVAGADNAIGHIVESVHRAGLAGRTVVIVTGDHGFVNVHTSFSPNTLLKKAGLLREMEAGNWKAWFKPAGGSSFLYLKDPGDGETLQSVTALLQKQPEFAEGKYRLLSRADLHQLGADPRAALALTAAPGFSFVGSEEGKFSKSIRRGTHGYLPDFPEIKTGFVAWGAGIKRNTRIADMELIDVAPLIAALLGLKLEGVEGRLRTELLKGNEE